MQIENADKTLTLSGLIVGVINVGLMIYAMLAISVDAISVFAIIIILHTVFYLPLNKE